MATTVAGPIAKARKVVPELMATSVVGVRLHRGVYHSGGYNYSGDCVGRADERISFDEFKASNTCDRCLRAYRISAIKPVGPFVDAIDTVLSEIKRSSGFSSDKSTLLVRQIDRMEGAVTQLEKEFEALKPSRPGEPLLSDADQKRFDELVRSGQAATAALKRQLQSPAEREKVLELARQELRPDYVDDYGFDTTPTLVGFVYFSEHAWPKIVKVLVEQFAVRLDPVVLLVPRFVADYLAGISGARRNGLEPSASAHDMTPAQIDTAALLWEPEGVGPLSSLFSATKAGRDI